MPLAPDFGVRATDSNGDAISGATRAWYTAGTTTLVSAYSDLALTVAQSNPLTADGGGKFAATYLASGSYKLVIKDASDVTIFERDNVIVGLASLDDVNTRLDEELADGLNALGDPLKLKLTSELFFGFDNGTTDTQIYTGASRAPQGFDKALVSGTLKQFSLQRSAGSSYKISERMRIVQFPDATDGSQQTHDLYTNELNVGHGQDLSHAYDGSQLYFYAGIETLSGHEDNDSGKGFSRIQWNGASTDQSDCTNYQLFGYEGSGHVFEQYNRSTVKVSPDGKYLLIAANDTKTVLDDFGHNLFIYDLAEILAAADPLDVLPLAGPFPLSPLPYYQLYFLQGLIAGENFIYTVHGLTGALDCKAIRVWDYSGNPVRSILFDGPRGSYTEDQLLNHPTLGIPVSFEPEGCTEYDGDVYVQFTDVWREVGDIVSWRGSNWASVTTSNTGNMPNEGDEWVRTTRAATAGAWDESTTYNVGTNYTRQTKVIYRVSETKSESGELPLLAGMQNQLPVGFYLGESAADQAHRYGRDWNVNAYSEATGEYLRSFGYYSKRRLGIYDQRDGSDNDKYISIFPDFSGTRELMQLRALAADDNEGAWINMYGKDDSVNPGQILAGTTTSAGAVVNNIQLDPNTPDDSYLDFGHGSTRRLEGVSTYAKSQTVTLTISDDSGNDSATAMTTRLVRIGDMVTIYAAVTNVSTAGMTAGDNLNIGTLPTWARPSHTQVLNGTFSNFTLGGGAFTVTPRVYTDGHIDFYEMVNGGGSLVANVSQFASGSTDFIITGSYVGVSL